MTTIEADWEQRIAALWAAFDDHEPEEFLAKIRELARERPPDDALALFELASANDAVGREDEAAQLYRRALAAGLTGERRRRAVIQLASTLRNLGQAEESVVLLTAEREAGADHLDDVVAAFLALALVDVGREREAVSLALATLAPHLSRYNRAVTYYADALMDKPA